MDFDEARGRVLGLLERGDPSSASGRRRVLLGIAGAPGAGKTTLAERLVTAVRDDGRYRAAHVPMDGFHLADVELDRLGRRDRKGALDTFDGWGYRALLQRLRDRPDEPVYAPGFERVLEQPVAASIAVGPEVDLVVSEGNWLLVDGPPWRDAAALLDEVWFADAPLAVRRARLVARHVAFGKPPAAAAAWVEAVDLPNAEAIEPGRDRADAVVVTG
ncbi:nucleoside/nucleotide kinase family protein [Amnibacterium setariae]|uniref:nucleoside/nucleotide kinase family protein n=1 Tax=Amnibacterium setariae TaxID=2306585 RepID=UPI001F01E397|nr:nucleoside/nucleotide kinase family protein [Amnibacterium setariae]